MPSHASKRSLLISRDINWNTQRGNSIQNSPNIRVNEIVQSESTANRSSDAQGLPSHIAMPVHSGGLYTTSGGIIFFNVILVGLAVQSEAASRRPGNDEGYWQ